MIVTPLSIPLRKVQLAVCICTVFATGFAATTVAEDYRPSVYRSPATYAITARIPQRATHDRSRLATPLRPAMVLPVTSCADDGSPGTLRAVVSGAATGDTVDLSQLNCSSITLLTGQIEIQVHDLTIEGPGASALTINGDYGSSNATTDIGRVFNHRGTGTLTVDSLTIANGLINNPGFAFEYGGCILSGGSVALNHSTVTGCRVISGHEAHGGGIAASGAVTIYHSTVSNNIAMVSGYYSDLVASGGIHSGGPLTITASLIDGNRSEVSYTQGNHQGISQAKGGGASCYGSLVTISDSVVSNNFAGCDTTSTSCYQAFAGGIAAQNGLVMLSSTISNNTAEATSSRVSGGGLYTGGSSGVISTISYSTISNNQAKNGGGILVANVDSAEIKSSSVNNNSAMYQGGGIWVADGALAVVNATISGNAASGRTTGLGGGMSVGNNGFAHPITLKNSTVTLNYSSGPLGGGGIVDGNRFGPSNFGSSIVAGNTVRVSPAMYDADLGAALGAINGANNLIIAANGVTLPPDTLNADPMLGPLQDNGGPTFTHALLTGSPAIDTGNNVANLDFDQRATGYPRVSGAATDIGAFEVQVAQPDLIFANGFEGTSPL